MTSLSLQQRILSRNVSTLARHLPRTGIIQVRQPTNLNTSFERAVVLYSYQGKYALASETSVVPVTGGGSITISEKLLFVPDYMDLDLSTPNLYLFIFDTDEDSLNNFPLAHRIIDIDSTQAPGASLVTLERTDESLPRTLVTRIIEDIKSTVDTVVPDEMLLTLAAPTIYIDSVLGSTTNFSCSPVTRAVAYQWRYKVVTTATWLYDSTQIGRTFSVKGTTAAAKYSVECRASDNVDFGADDVEFSEWASYFFVGSVAKLLADGTSVQPSLPTDAITRTFTQAVRRRDGYFANVPPPRPSPVQYITHTPAIPVRLPEEPLVYYDEIAREWVCRVFYGVDNIGYPPITHFQYQLRYGPPGQEFYGDVLETVGYDDFVITTPNLPMNRIIGSIRGKFYMPEPTITPDDELVLYNKAFDGDISRIPEFSSGLIHSINTDEISYVDILFNRAGLYTPKDIQNEAVYEAFSRQNPGSTRADLAELHRRVDAGDNFAALSFLSFLQQANSFVPKHKLAADDIVRRQIYGFSAESSTVIGANELRRRGIIAGRQLESGVGVFGRGALGLVDLFDPENPADYIKWQNPHSLIKALTVASLDVSTITSDLGVATAAHALGLDIARILGEVYDIDRHAYLSPFSDISEMGNYSLVTSLGSRAVLRPELGPRPIMGWYPNYGSYFAGLTAEVAYFLDTYDDAADMSLSDLQLLPVIGGGGSRQSPQTNQAYGPGGGSITATRNPARTDLANRGVTGLVGDGRTGRRHFQIAGSPRLNWIKSGEVELTERSLPIKGQFVNSGVWLVGMALPLAVFSGAREAYSGPTTPIGRLPAQPRDLRAPLQQFESMITLIFGRNTTRNPILAPDTTTNVGAYVSERLKGDPTEGPFVAWRDALMLPEGVKTRDDFNKALDRFDPFLLQSGNTADGFRLLDKGGVGLPDPDDGSSVSMVPRFFSEHGGRVLASGYPTGSLSSFENLYYVFTKYDSSGGIIARRVGQISSAEFIETKLVDGGALDIAAVAKQGAAQGFHLNPQSNEDDLNAVSFYALPGFNDIFLLTEAEMGDDGVECEFIMFEGDPNFVDQPFLPIQAEIYSVNSVGRSANPTIVVGPRNF